MVKPVAVSGDGVASASTATAPSNQPAWKGAWSAGTPVETLHRQLSVGGVRVLHELSCTFTFTGVDTSVSPTPPPTPPTTSTVVLRAGTTVLRESGRFVLLDGDRQSDSHGNEVAVSATGHLRST